MSTLSKTVLFALVCFGTSSVYGQKSDYSINISMPQSSVKFSADIPVAIMVKNVSDHELRMVFSSGETGIAMDFDVTILDDSGNPVPETHIGVCMHGKTPLPKTFSCGLITISQAMIPIPIGGEHKSITHINQIFDLTKPGNYTVQVKRLDKSTKVMVKSNILAFTVTP